MEKIIGIIGVVLAITIASAFSNDKKNIKWKSVGFALITQIVLAFLMLKTPLWNVVQIIGNGFQWVFNQASEGINFVFGGISDNFVFFINSLLPIVFVSGLLGVLFHFGLIQKFVALFGKIIAKALDVDVIVGINGITNMFMGQSDALFLTKAYLPSASESVVFATLVGGMTSISMSVLGVYTGLGADMTLLVISMPLSVLSTFMLTQILMPTSYVEVKNLQIDESDKGVNFIETAVNYSNQGFKACIGIAISLILFLSLVGMINNLIGSFIDGVTLQSILAYIFAPFSFLMGVPKEEVMKVAELLATRFVTNEVVAYGMPQFAMLSMKAKSMITVALSGFTGIASIAIMIGGYSAVAKNKIPTVASLGFKALITSTVATMITGIMVGLFI